MHQNCRGRIPEALMEDGRPRPSSQQLLTNCHFERSEKSAFYMGTADSSCLKAFGMTTLEAWVEQLCGKERSNPSTSLTAQKNLCARSPKLAPYPALVLRATATRWVRARSSNPSRLMS